MVKGTETGATKGLAGSRHAQITMPMKESTKNSMLWGVRREVVGGWGGKG
jgi:hypothetical protein